MNCWLFHQWSQWEVAGTGLIKRHPEDGGGVFGQFTTQRRTCDRCGLVQLRTDKY